MAAKNPFKSHVCVFLSLIEQLNSLDNHVGVMPLGGCSHIVLVGFSRTTVGIKAGGGFLGSETVASAGEWAIKRIEAVLDAGEDVIVAGLGAVVAVALFESRRLASASDSGCGPPS